MKIKRKRIPSLYDETTVIKKGMSRNIFFQIFFILALLMVVRSLNLFLLWNTSKLELKKNQLLNAGDITFFGLSGYKTAKDQFLKDVNFKQKKIVALSYFNMLQSGVFLIYNRGPSTFFDLGRILIYIEPGQSIIKLYPSDIYQIQSETSHTSKFFGYSLLSPLFEIISKRFVTDTKIKKTSDARSSFILKDLSKSKFLKIPYLLYFYLPLVLIVLITISYDFSFLISFFYYVGLYLLFDFKEVFVRVPFFWLFKHFNIKISDIMGFAISGFVLVIFVVFGTIGFSHWGKKENMLWTRLFIFFFLFLPFFLRF